MQQKPSFVTIFTEAENFHLVKDVGQIPYQVQKHGEFESKLVCYRNEASYPFLETEVKGLTIEFIPDRGRIGVVEIGILNYLRKNATGIDVLHLFHFRRDHLAYILLYKSLNPEGRVYIKLDLDIRFFKKYDAFFYSRYRLYNRLLKRIQASIIERTDLLSVETTEACNYIPSVIPGLANKMICLPNGIDGDQANQLAQPKPFREKENILITVGRIGTYQKNTELLLESLLLADLAQWSVYIIGSETADFQSHKEHYFRQHPQMEGKVVFIGNVTDRAELINWYNRAKVFLLSSRFEGFPLCLPEAAWFGNYIISTDLASSDDISSKGKFGKLAAADPKSYANAITEVLHQGFLSESLSDQIRKHAAENFTWKNLISRLIKPLT